MTTYESIKIAAAFIVFMAVWLFTCWLLDRLEDFVKKKRKAKRNHNTHKPL